MPIILRPLQQPHPPLWYGTTIPENVDWPAANDVNIVSIALRPTVRIITDRYRAVRAGRASVRRPLLGVARHVVVAETDQEARRLPGAPIRAGARASAGCLRATAWSRGSSASIRRPSMSSQRSKTASPVRPQPCANSSRAEIEASGANYLLSWFAFGDMTLAESLRSLELFSREVMPAFAATQSAGRNESITPNSAEPAGRALTSAGILDRHQRGILGIAQRQRGLDVADMRRRGELGDEGLEVFMSGATHLRMKSISPDSIQHSRTSGSARTKSSNCLEVGVGLAAEDAPWRRR